MIKDDLLIQFENGLNQLKLELNSYNNLESVWKISGNIKNSGGNLALHLIGNLNHFVGFGLGNTGYIRNR